MFEQDNYKVLIVSQSISRDIRTSRGQVRALMHPFTHVKRSRFAARSLAELDKTTPLVLAVDGVAIHRWTAANSL